MSDHYDSVKGVDWRSSPCDGTDAGIFCSRKCTGSAAGVSRSEPYDFWMANR